jgi:nitrogen fixation protein NifU and related proteins
MALEELYREVILDHYRNPRNRTELGETSAHAEGVNPLCGDEVSVDIHFEGDLVDGVSVRGQGCSISQSSASMMSEAIKGKSKEEIVELSHRFKAMLSTEDGELELDESRPGSVLGDLEALQGVKNYPVRIKCASLPWATLEEALEEALS